MISTVLQKLAVGGMTAASVLMLAGCGLVDATEAPDSFAGSWSSTDGKSYLKLDADGSGVFVMCEPDDHPENLRYNFEASSWPAEISVEWRRSEVTDSPQSTRLYLSQDWSLRKQTRTGFNSATVILEWRDDALEMGVNLVVRYVPTEKARATCNGGFQ